MGVIFRIALRNMKRRKVRYILTTVTLVIGVALFGGISIASDSFNVMFINDIDRRMGTADILVRASDTDDDWFDTGDLDEIFEDIKEIDHFSYRISGYNVYVSATDDGDQEEDSENTAVYGIDPESEQEQKLGGTLEILDSKVDGETIEELLDYEDDDTDERVIVITESLKIKLGSDFEAGDSVWILPRDGEELGYSIYDTGTWIEYTVVAIIRDMGEARDFDPETPEEFSTPSYGPCLFSNIENAHELVDGTDDIDDDSVNLAVIGIKDINLVGEIVNKLEKKLNDDDWSVCDLKTDSIEEINTSVATMNTMFMMFALVALILSIILILNIFNIIKEEQEYETGMLQAVGASKSETFKMFLTQGAIMGIIGAIIGTICSFFISYLIFYLVIEGLKNMPGTFGEYFASMTYEIILYPQTIIITLAIGVLSCILAAIYPSYKASKKPLIECLNPLAQKTEREKRKIKKKIIYALFGSFLIALGTYLIFFYINFGPDQGGPENSQNTATISMVAPTLVLLGMILIVALAVRPIVAIFIKLFSPYLKQTKLLTKKNVLRHRKRTVLTFSMIALTTSYLVGISVMMGSMQEGVNTSVSDIMGSEIRIFAGDTPRDFEEELLEQKGVEDVMGITQTNARIWIEDENKWIGHKYLEEDWDESVSVYVLDTEKIATHMTRTSIVKPHSMTLEKMMDKLTDENTVLITSDLADEFNIDVGDEIPVKFTLGIMYPNLSEMFESNSDDAIENSVEEELTVIAIIEELEGFVGMEVIGGQEENYNIFISWETYEELTLNELPGGNTDLIFKQKSQTGNSTLDSVQSNWFNFSSVEDILKSVDGIEYYTARMDYVTMTQVGDPFNLNTYDATTQVIGMRTNNSGNLISDSEIGQHQIKRALAGYEDLTLEEILASNDNLCVVDETFYYNQIEGENPNFDVGDYIYIFPQNTTSVNIYTGTGNTDVDVDIGTLLEGDEDELTLSDNVNMTFESDERDLALNITLHLSPLYYYKAISVGIEYSVNSTIDELGLSALNIYNNEYDYLGDIKNTAETNNTLTFDSDHYYVDLATNELKLRIVGYNSTASNNYSLNIDCLNFTMAQSTDSTSDPSTWARFQVAAIIKDPKLYKTERYGWQAGYETMVDVTGTENAVYIDYGKARDLVYVDYAGSDPSNDNVTSVLIHCDDIEEIEDTKENLEDELDGVEGGNWSIVDLKSTTLESRTNVLEWFVWIEEGADDEEVLDGITEYMEDEGYIIGFAFTKSFLADIFKGFISLITSTFSGILIFAIVIAMIGLTLHCLLSTMARRREIGMLRSIGLNKKGVIRTISGETLVVAFLGVIIGIISGLITGSLMVLSMPETGFLKATLTVPWVTIAILITVTAITAITSSRFPSRWAANINIIDAVRTR